MGAREDGAVVDGGDDAAATAAVGEDRQPAGREEGERREGMSGLGGHRCCCRCDAPCSVAMHGKAAERDGHQCFCGTRTGERARDGCSAQTGLATRSKEALYIPRNRRRASQDGWTRRHGAAPHALLRPHPLFHPSTQCERPRPPKEFRARAVVTAAALPAIGSPTHCHLSSRQAGKVLCTPNTSIAGKGG